MRDIPVFCTELGVASLVLKKIPYTKEAYIHLQDSCDLEAFLKECCDFCVAAGAERVFATGHDSLKKYTYHTKLIKMQSSNCFDETAEVYLFPLQEQTIEMWRAIYNERMLNVPNAAFMSLHDMEDLLNSGGAYFVHQNGVLIGIGAIKDNNVEVIVSVVPGKGEKVLIALCSAIRSDTVTLIVAENNMPAISLYNKLGFIKTEELESWYKIF